MNESDSFGEHCVGYATRRAARAVTNLFNAHLRGLDLNLPQFGLLAAIKKRPGQSIAAISALLTLDESTLTRNLAVLERRNLVISEGGRGRSGKRVWLTPEGEAIGLAGHSVWEEANRRIMDRMGAHSVAETLAVLGALEAAAIAVLAEEPVP